MDTNEFMGDYLTPSSCNVNDIVEIVGEGIKQMGRFGRELAVPVLLGDRKLIYNPNKRAIALFRAKFGADSKQWVSRKFQVSFGEWNNKKYIVPNPLV